MSKLRTQPVSNGTTLQSCCGLGTRQGLTCHIGTSLWGEQAAHAAQMHQQAEQETLDMFAGREAAHLQEQPQHGGVPSLQ